MDRFRGFINNGIANLNSPGNPVDLQNITLGSNGFKITNTGAGASFFGFQLNDTFIGGTYEMMMRFNRFAREQHTKYYGKESYNHGFYSKYPGELFILKFVFENKIDHKRLTACCELYPDSANQIWHIGELPNNWDSKNGMGLRFLNHYRQLHQTKMKLDILDEVVKYIMGEPNNLAEMKAKQDAL